MEARTFELGADHSTWDVLPEVSTPTVVIAGRVEPSQPSADRGAIAGELPAGRYVLDAALDHFGPFTQPAHLAAVVRAAVDEGAGDPDPAVPVAVTPPPYHGAVFEVPTSLSPSRVESFTSCPLAFRFASIEKLPEPPSIHATRGSLVHRALELAYARPAGERAPALFHQCLEQARDEYRLLPDFAGLDLDDDAVDVFDAECRTLVDTYLTMEDPQRVHPIGLELRLSAAVGALPLRGIIDRLELRDGELVVTDYKTGRAPSINWEQRSLAGVHFYSFLCEQVFGRRPAVIRLMYLQQRRDHRGHALRAVRALHHHPHHRRVAGRRAGVRRPATSSPGPTACCSSCGFQRWCPSFGGDPEQAAVELARRRPRSSRDRPRRRAGRRPRRDAPAAERTRPALPRADRRPLRPLGGRGAGADPRPPGGRRRLRPATRLGDFSLIWHFVSVGRGLTPIAAPTRSRSSPWPWASRA